MLGQWSVLFPKKVVCYGTVFKHPCMSCQWNSVSSGQSPLHDLEHFLLNVRDFLIKELGKGNCTFTVLSLPLSTSSAPTSRRCLCLLLIQYPGELCSGLAETAVTPSHQFTAKYYQLQQQWGADEANAACTASPFAGVLFCSVAV